MPRPKPPHSNVPALSSRSSEARNRAIRALALMRREKVSLAAACRLEHVKPSTFLRYVGSAIRQDKPGGRFRASAGDRFRRDLQIPTAVGLVTVAVYGSKNAKLVSDYLNAVAAFLRTGDKTLLKPFKGKVLKARGHDIALETDPQTLSTLAQAGALQVDHLYASFVAPR